VLGHHQLDLCFILLSCSFSRGRSQLDKGSLPCSVKSFSTITISRLLLLEVRMFRGLKLLKTQWRLNRSAMLVKRKVILPIDAPIRAHARISLLPLHLPLPVEPTLFLLLLGKTMHVGESTMLLWRKPKKLRMFSLVYFSSMALLQLCYLILEHHILSYSLHMWEA
jgi:hypothetical protein